MRAGKRFQSAWALALAAAPTLALGAVAAGPAAPPGQAPAPVPALYLPALARGPWPRAYAWLVPEAPQVAVGGLRVLTLRLRGLAGASQVHAEIQFDASRLAVVDEDPIMPGVQVLPGDWPPAAARFFDEWVSNGDGQARITAWSFAAPLPREAVIARLRVRGRYPGPAWLQAGANVPADYEHTSWPELARTEAWLEVTGPWP